MICITPIPRARYINSPHCPSPRLLAPDESHTAKTTTTMSFFDLDTEMLFAEDLMHFVMQGYDLPFQRTPTFMRSVPVRFVPCVGHVVRHLHGLQEEKTVLAFDYLRCTILSGEHFDEFCCGMVEAHFEGAGFRMLDFLRFCAQISRLAVLFYANNVLDAPRKTVDVLRSVLRREKISFASAGGWDALYDICFCILHRIPRRQRCRAPSKGARDEEAAA